ncbi:MAG TPA: class I SAM-dependent methyltransferase [Solirubrobacteraceae bacterium]|nr:class I SAM-dependent methyltransferase [Solirubrobacteraceae bacterium]
MDEAPGFFSVASFVRAALPAPPARVLEVGAGSGELAATLRDAGYEVLAIDPASESPDVRAAALLELDEPAGSFDAAVAVVSLHHVEPLEGSLRHLADLVRPDGVLVVDEFDVDRFDERAARWLIDARADHEHHADPEALVGELRQHLHGLDRIRAALDPWFAFAEPVRGPYLYRWYVPAGLREPEEQLIAAGALPATGARLVGRRRRAD